MMSYNTTDTQPSQSVNAWQKTIVPSPLEAPQKQRGRRSTADERKRAVRACDQCRRVKEKCEGGIPCRRCLHFSRPCEFNSISSHSNDLNSSPGGSSASNALLRDQRHRLLRDRARYMERILKHEIKGISLDTDSLRVRAEAIPEDGFRGEGSAAPQDSSSEELAIEDETCTIDPVKGETATHYSGEFSYWNFSMRIKRQLETRVQSPREQTQGTDSSSDYVRAGQLQSSANNLSIAISCCPPRPIADFLVRIFFEFAETYYFYVAKSWLLTKLDLIYDNPEILTSKDVGTVGIILTVFAIGTQYAYLDSPTQNVRGHPGSKYSEDEIGTMFYQQAIRLLPEIIESSTLESVQACLLFGVYALPIDASGLGYIYVNLALRLGMQNGMHRKYTGNALSDVMIETRNRVWWTACVLERKICIFHGRPLSVLQSDIDADLPKDREDLQSAGLPSNVAHMCASIYLTRKLEEYLNQMNMSRNYQKHDVPSLSARLITIKTELATWWSSLAILQEKTDQHSHPAHHRSTMHLRLEFCLIRMFVGRPFMFGGQSARLDSNSPPSVFASQAPTAANGEMRIPSRQQLVEDCVQAAKEALEICSSLCYSGHGLARGSYIEYSSCRASLLVLIGYSVQNQSNQFQTVVHDGLVMIRNMSAAGESARSEIAFIEALERSLKSRDDGNTLAPGSTNSGYDSFKHWEWIWKNGGAAHPPREGLRPETAGTVAIEPKASASTWGPFATTSNHTPYDWRTSILSETDRDNFFAMPGSDVNLAFQPSNDWALFEGGNLRLGSNGSMFARQAMNQFPKNTEFDFTASGQVR